MTSCSHKKFIIRRDISRQESGFVDYHLQFIGVHLIVSTITKNRNSTRGVS
jgi:hypothetical protein